MDAAVETQPREAGKILVQKPLKNLSRAHVVHSFYFCQNFFLKRVHLSFGWN